jgi:hypothetical protein
MAKYNRETILHYSIERIDDYDTSSGEDNIGWKVIDRVRKCVKEGEDKLGFTCKDYTVLFVPSHRRTDEVFLFVNILSNKSIIIVLSMPYLNKEYLKLISDEIKDKIKYLGDDK